MNPGGLTAALDLAGLPAILFTFFALICLLGYLRVRGYRAAFRAPARRDDSCVCRKPHPKFNVLADDAGFDLPPGIAGSKQTALLELRLAATVTGSWSDPWIEVQGAGIHYRQYFERGLRGVRFINLSPLLHAPPGELSRVSLTGHHLRWERAGALHVHSPPALEGDCLIVAPHPDDAEIATFGLYSQRDSWIVTVTCGERTPTDLRPVAPSGEKARWAAWLRLWDSLSIPQLGNVPRDRCLNLVFPDDRLREMYCQPEQAQELACESSVGRRLLRARNSDPRFQHGGAQCRWEDLVAELTRVLEVTRPRTVACPHPLLDCLRDHVFTSIALAQALRRSAHVPDEFLLYVVHTKEAQLHPFGNSASIVSIPPSNGVEDVADSLYSHSLATEVRRAKYFAVEAAHDLRRYSEDGPRSLTGLARLLKNELAAFVAGTGARPDSFLRRAPRPNEIYYVASPDSFAELASRAEQAARCPPSAMRAR